jgi:hypothetical protein
MCIWYKAIYQRTSSLLDIIWMKLMQALHFSEVMEAFYMVIQFDAICQRNHIWVRCHIEHSLAWCFSTVCVKKVLRNTSHHILKLNCMAPNVAVLNVCTVDYITTTTTTLIYKSFHQFCHFVMEVLSFCVYP